MFWLQFCILRSANHQSTFYRSRQMSPLVATIAPLTLQRIVWQYTLHVETPRRSGYAQPAAPGEQASGCAQDHDLAMAIEASTMDGVDHIQSGRRFFVSTSTFASGCYHLCATILLFCLSHFLSHVVRLGP